MTKSNITKQFAQVKPGALHAGVDLALEKNVVVVINEKAERIDRFSFSQDREGYDYFLAADSRTAPEISGLGSSGGHGAIQLFLETVGQGTGREAASLSSGECLHGQETSRRGSTRPVKG